MKHRCLCLVGGLLTCSSTLAQHPLGVDVSNYQGANVNWQNVRSSGVSFAWAKATEGVSFTDADFSINEANATAAGIYIGAYHFAHPASNTPGAEASYFWSVAGPYVRNGGAYLMPMLDMEVFTGVTGASSYSDWANQWCNAIVNAAAAAGVTVRPVIYVSACNACNFDTSISQWIPWIANYNGQNPQTGTPWNVCSGCAEWGAGVWKVWQYSSSGAVSGITGNCDLDVFNGTAADLINTLVIGAVGITNPPANVMVVAEAPATFRVGATGQGPLYYQWRFNQSNIAAATASTYTVPSAQLGNAGPYSVVVTNSLGSVVSTPAFLSVIAPLTNGPGAPLAPAGLVDYWAAEGNGLDLLSGYSARPANGFSYSSGKEGLAFHFDGSSGYLSNGAPSLAVPWTVCLWVNRQNAPGSSAALMSDGTYSLKLEQYNGTRKVGLTQLGVGDYTFNYTVPAGIWTHLALVGTGSQTLLYANGVLQGSLTNIVPLPRAYFGATYVASGARFVDYLLASMDEVMCFNRALGGNEVAAIYNAGSAGVVRAPEFIGIGQAGNNQLRLSVQGLTGKSITLRTSSDLANWTLLATLPNPTGALQYTNSVLGLPERFYRASQP